MVDERVTEGAGNKAKHTFVQKLSFILVTGRHQDKGKHSINDLLDFICKKSVSDLLQPDGVIGLSNKDGDTGKKLTVNFEV